MSYETDRRDLESSILTGIDVESTWDGQSIKPGTLTSEQISWLASWLAGEGFTRRKN